MKTKIMLFIGAAALVTLSFTFASVDKPEHKANDQVATSNASQVGGLISDEVVK